MVDFPQELIDAIIDEVAATKHWFDYLDRETLKSCALAAHAFSEQSQRHLFTSLTLWKIDSPPPGLTLATNARLLSYVLNLTLMNLDLGDQERQIHNIQLFTLCNRVTRCCIRFSGRSGWKWNSLPDEICGPLFSFLALPTLRCLQLDAFPGTSLPPSLIHYALASYSEVALNIFQLETDTDAVLLPTRPPAHIQPLSKLCLSYQPDSCPGLHTLMLGDDVMHHLQHLQHLELVVPRRGSLHGLEEILPKCGDSLQHLIINFEWRHDDPLQLPHLPELRLLTLKAAMRRLRIPYGLMRTLIILPECTPSLEVLTIVVVSEFDETQLYPEFHNNRCTEEDMALKSLPRLREVNVDATTAYLERDENFSKVVLTDFRMAHEAGKLSYVYQPAHSRKYHPMRYFSN
ncbi:hypothetical protein B0H16DRAFT_1889752 [Mycena metata]|uniref:Uncharacterized protein n=1 Tax=Mycena metata TaxID=1033252 RepID=A0AAD7ILG0_9AGAR|nr:hypothetical protein B0H16DRAFT_1889752 [Mycena metata]